jgi:hypothetical protein
MKSQKDERVSPTYTSNNRPEQSNADLPQLRKESGVSSVGISRADTRHKFPRQVAGEQHSSPEKHALPRGVHFSAGGPSTKKTGLKEVSCCNRLSLSDEHAHCSSQISCVIGTTPPQRSGPTSQLARRQLQHASSEVGWLVAPESPGGSSVALPVGEEVEP